MLIIFSCLSTITICLILTDRIQFTLEKQIRMAQEIKFLVRWLLQCFISKQSIWNHFMITVTQCENSRIVTWNQFMGMLKLRNLPFLTFQKLQNLLIWHFSKSPKFRMMDFQQFQTSKNSVLATFDNLKCQSYRFGTFWSWKSANIH